MHDEQNATMITKNVMTSVRMVMIHDDCKDDDKCDKPYCEIHNTDCDLLITLCNGVLKDKKDATGEIAANHQFHLTNHHKRMPYTQGRFLYC